MYKARTDRGTYLRNTSIAFLAVSYSIYALYASGMEAVMGGMLVLAIGYLLYGFVAKRFVGTQDSRVMPMTPAPGAADQTGAA
jgi:putrescine:ornithine antiporter